VWLSSCAVADHSVRLTSDQWFWSCDSLVFL